MTKHLFEAETIADMRHRIGLLTQHNEPVWGSMDVGQMLAHCSLVLENALGIKHFTIGWPMRLLTYMVKSKFRQIYVNEQAFTPMRTITKRFSLLRAIRKTNPFIIEGQHNLDIERGRLLNLLNIFYEEGFERCSQAVHPHWGRFTPAEWARGQYKHLDHHLRQFGI